MTAQIIRLPDRIYPAPIDRDEQVQNARAVLRHAGDFDDQIIRDACLILQAWGDANDWIEADAMMLALRLNRRPVPRPTLPDYRAEVLPLLGFLAFGAACLALGCL